MGVTHSGTGCNMGGNTRWCSANVRGQCSEASVARLQPSRQQEQVLDVDYQGQEVQDGEERKQW